MVAQCKPKPCIATLKPDCSIVHPSLASKIPKVLSRTSLLSKPIDVQSFSSLAIPEHVEDIDKGDENNVLLESVYVKDIYEYLRKLEVSLLDM